ncbi:class I SAM-dependent methyltransferase [Enterococcus durans]|uniref:tRNA (mnm(5)s(2)U34)-methyltransferase n=1 Tax=Enterococcus durans TaxID=53345 RepID=UPI00232B7AFD|nr:class I SAM-dependent methyltransferase [Enterococcus durans]MDB1654020.1 class I SAM-dependent methyltransferase [Enterococcus durans]MDB1656383.1 class I SAM-dependent methyltransferase [Enterococcus durans]MDB1664822.1 class I SAM-dependent methyltransferase [Enterococcus durans]MDB1670079.1 class I SAM-dependent methyltransferase [Enterococcus durans]MDB1672345.1 class I SAM-dependent methyltransferase [Enterococcus durans]
MLQTALHFSHSLLEEILQPGDHVIDATMGNGYDTVFMAEKIGKTGHVYSFDVQKEALLSTKSKLTEQDLLDRTSLFLQGHETLGTVVDEAQPIKAGIFNLGYLPKSDKSVITLPETTRTAMEEILKRLVPRGRMILVVYYGHAGGEKELDMVQDYCQSLPQEKYNVLKYQFINQKNNPPILYCVEKKVVKKPVQLR